MNCKKNVSIKPLRLLITRGAGVEKSHLMKIICMFFHKSDESIFSNARQAQGPYSSSH